MRRAATTVALALLAAAGAAVAGPPKDATEFAARDLEGRWASYREAPDPVAAWTAFLAGRKDWDLLEWIALTARTSEALHALEEADAPAWVRCAAWRLEGADSHADEDARALLTGRRRAEVLDWLERNPKAVTGPLVGVLATLREQVAARDRVDASRLSPPWVAVDLLRLLEPPPTVESAAPVPRAKAGVTYAQQVERTLEVWARSSLRTDPWVARVVALVGHADPAVRRAAALACAYLPPPRVPAEALERVLQSTKEPDDVRAAAAVGLSFSSEPRVPLLLLHVAEDEKHPAATAALSRLGDLGDEFAAARLAKPGPPAREAMRIDALARIRARLAAEPPAGFAARVSAMLRRAAWADLSCDPFETEIVPFVVELVRPRREEPVVKVALDESVAAGDAPGDRLAPRVKELVETIRSAAAGKAR